MLMLSAVSPTINVVIFFLLQFSSLFMIYCTYIGSL